MKAMSEKQFKAFLEKVKADTNLQEMLKAASAEDAVVATAKDAGFLISVDDLKQAQAEISDEELESATGGTIVIYTICEMTRGWHDERIKENSDLVF